MTETVNTAIEADPKLPIIRLTRDFAATPEQLFRAHKILKNEPYHH